MRRKIPNFVAEIILEGQSRDYRLEIVWWRSVKIKFLSVKRCAVGVVLGFWILTSSQNLCSRNTFRLKAYCINKHWKKVGGGPGRFCRVGYRFWRCGAFLTNTSCVCLLRWNLSSVLRKVSKSPASICFERQSFLKICWGQKKKVGYSCIKKHFKSP